MAYVIRKAKIEDIPSINQLFIEMQETIYNAEDIIGYEDNYLDKFFSNNKNWICVSEYNNQVVGYLSIEVYENKNYIYLDDLAVTEQHRFNGIGTILIHTAEEYAKSISISEIVLHVEESNTQAQEAYLKLGFVKNTFEGSRIRMIKKVIV